MAWPTAARDRETFCVSCHTAVPYAVSRPALRKVLAEETPTVTERKLLDNVRKRVRLWQNVGLCYSSMAAESRGTKAILNALILVSYDAQNGQLSADARAAFANMWALQQTEGDEKGSWAWLQFGSEPWEAYDSRYYGASLVAVAVGTAPMNYRATPEIEYLNREYHTQSPVNQVVLLWASLKLPGLLEHGKQEAIINEVLSRQQADGGWSLSSLVGTWKRKDGTPLVMQSDGYATGLITFALQQAGISREDIRVKRGLTWLVRNQSIWNGHWAAYSLNKKRRNPFSDVARFMDDAATAYAVLALTQGNQ